MAIRTFVLTPVPRPRSADCLPLGEGAPKGRMRGVREADAGAERQGNVVVSLIVTFFA